MRRHSPCETARLEALTWPTSHAPSRSALTAGCGENECPAEAAHRTITNLDTAGTQQTEPVPAIAVSKEAQRLLEFGRNFSRRNGDTTLPPQAPDFSEVAPITGRSAHLCPARSTRRRPKRAALTSRRSGGSDANCRSNGVTFRQSTYRLGGRDAFCRIIKTAPGRSSGSMDDPRNPARRTATPRPETARPIGQPEIDCATAIAIRSSRVSGKPDQTAHHRIAHQQPMPRFAAAKRMKNIRHSRQQPATRFQRGG